MTKTKEIYKCEVCGNITEVLHAGFGELVCCNQPMINTIAKKNEEGVEKHLPVIESLPPQDCSVSDGFLVKVGETEHPSTEEHYIEWIEINTTDGKSGKKFLKAGDQPEVKFYTRKNIISVRAYCNIHGLWETDVA